MYFEVLANYSIQYTLICLLCDIYLSGYIDKKVKRVLVVFMFYDNIVFVIEQTITLCVLKSL